MNDSTETLFKLAKASYKNDTELSYGFVRMIVDKFPIFIENNKVLAMFLHMHMDEFEDLQGLQALPMKVSYRTEPVTKATFSVENDDCEYAILLRKDLKAIKLQRYRYDSNVTDRSQRVDNSTKAEIKVIHMFEYDKAMFDDVESGNKAIKDCILLISIGLMDYLKRTHNLA